MGLKGKRIWSGKLFTIRSIIVCTILSRRVNKCRRLRWNKVCCHVEEGRSVFEILIGKPTGKTPLGRPRRG